MGNLLLMLPIGKQNNYMELIFSTIKKTSPVTKRGFLGRIAHHKTARSYLTEEQPLDNHSFISLMTFQIIHALIPKDSAQRGANIQRANIKANIFIS